MERMRDGGGFFESGGPAPEPAGDSVSPDGSKNRNFRTGDELPLGRSPSAAPAGTGDDLTLRMVTQSIKEPVGSPMFVPPSVAGALALHSLTLQGDGDLVAASRALRQAGVKVWVTVASSVGPLAVDLSQYLRSRGLE